ncbi:rhodanese-like domain-containing protein [Flavobacteriaceae bacterium F89]|uniref:Rhodanese-like domain-containing protein n=1 Tax=Cerina litoralis TaxID=2874477 RepID=A0AAE3ES90_9FLAO|nr:rhodanese-like domain-containing protein [Cerina litoralis]MCG2460028.1 rhodanese-like domain-containing protein [Cerina litoralis]
MSFLSALFGTKRDTSDKIKLLDTNTYSKAITGNKVQLVDVRTSDEYRGGHIKNAVNIDFFNRSNFERSFEKMNKEEPVYLYCRSGSRSHKAAKRLIDMGFTQIFDLRGGYMHWK